MKIVVINGSEKKGCTFSLKQIFLEKLGTDNEIKEWYLPKDMPHFCTGCFACINRSEEHCPHKDYVQPIWNSIIWADLIIICSPVYVFHATGQLKALLDHLFINWMPHRPKIEMFTKKAVILTTTIGAGAKNAEKDVKDSLRYWGIPKIYCERFALFDGIWKEVSSKRKIKFERKLNKLAKKIQKNKKAKVSLKAKGLFYIMRFVQKKVNENRQEKTPDYLYWKKQGWFDRKRPWKN